MPPAPTDPDLIALGAIRRPHGVRGEASVEIWTDSVERLAAFPSVTLVSPDERSRSAAEVEAIRPHAGRALVKFRGIESPEEVARFRDWTIEIPAAAARPLAKDEYFIHDLVGLRLVDESGTEQGTVVDVYEGGGGLLLSVRRGERSFEVPFAASICREIDLGSKTIVVALPDGIDEL